MKKFKKSKKTNTRVLLCGWMVSDPELGAIASTLGRSEADSKQMYERNFGVSWLHASQHGAVCSQVQVIKAR